ncbi:MAG: hypothetical protein Q9217_004407 [Psora testacea]
MYAVILVHVHQLLIAPSEGALEPRWPPKSPCEALLASPSGRNKVRHYYDRTSPSPSPLKKFTTTPDPNSILTVTKALEVEPQDDEDEETLQLQLQALEAKLKLKKLQQKRSNAALSVANNSREGAFDSARKENILPSSQKHAASGPSKDVQIPVSPHKKSVTAPEARSPGRVLLGIDKGLKARNVSLRKPIKEQEQNENPFPNSTTFSSIARKPLRRRSTTLPFELQAKSFSERIAKSRQHDKAQREREATRHEKRSTGFGVAQSEKDALKTNADETDRSSIERTKHKASNQTDGFSREQVLQAMSKPDLGLVGRSNNSAGIRKKQGNSGTDVWRNPNAEPDPTPFLHQSSNALEQRARSRSPRSNTSTDTAKDIDQPDQSSDSLFEPFSTLHLSKRLLPHNLLTRSFSDKSILRIPDLLAAVKSPDYCLPENLEVDYVVLGIIASKSSPISHKQTCKTSSPEDTTALSEATSSAQNAKGKYMVLTLTDLKWTLDLYLFTTAYTRFWKLVPGTVIALLNPNIMPPPPHKADTGRFSLTLNSSDDTVLEMGTSRDLGWCKAVRKDGKQCSDWIDKRHTEFCEFHVDRVVERTRRGRMAVQGMSAPFAPGGRKQGRTGFFGDGGKGTGPRSRRSEKSESNTDGFIREGQHFDRFTFTRLFVGPPAVPGRSAARLLDAEGMMIMRDQSKEERLRKRLAEREKENDIARKLGEGGNGLGSEYLRLRQPPDCGDQSPRSQQPFSHPPSQVSCSSTEPVDAGSLGLLGNKAKAVHLSPVKTLKRKGGIMSGDISARKKTRFLTEKGIREAGRDSLPGPEPALADADEDELEIE